MANRTKVLKHQRPLDAAPVKVLSPEERLGLRACLPAHVSKQAADTACDGLERAFAIYRSGLANKVSKRPETIKSDLAEIKGYLLELPDLIAHAEADNRRRIFRHLSGDRCAKDAEKRGEEEFRRICLRLKAAIQYADNRIRDGKGKRGPKEDKSWLMAELLRIWEETTAKPYRWSGKRGADAEKYASAFVIRAIVLGGVEADFRREYEGRAGAELDLGALLDKYHRKGVARLRNSPRSSDDSDHSDNEVLRGSKR
ncbi:MAG: hypothetical protein ACM359_04585 [Bacillota bacterium]